MKNLNLNPNPNVNINVKYTCKNGIGIHYAKFAGDNNWYEKHPSIYRVE
jgi:hypothetical protein